MSGFCICRGIGTASPPQDLSFKTGKARVAGVSRRGPFPNPALREPPALTRGWVLMLIPPPARSFVPLAASSAAPAQRVVGKRFVQRPQSAAPPFAAGYASQAAGIVLGTEYGGRAHAEKRHAVPQPAEKPDQDVAVRHTFQSHSHNSHPIQERDPIGQHGARLPWPARACTPPGCCGHPALWSAGYVGVEVSKSFGGEDHTSLRKQFEATKEKPRHANPMTMTMTSTSEPLQPRPMRKPGAPIADNLRTATGMAPLRDYSESKQRELKHVQHREWQSGETKALLSNSYAGPQASPTKLFDSRRERMDSERRNLIVHYSLPDWRTDIFESNQRLQLRGSEVLNKGYLYESSQAD